MMDVSRLSKQGGRRYPQGGSGASTVLSLRNIGSSSTPAATIFMRKTFSGLAGRVGSRQPHTGPKGL